MENPTNLFNKEAEIFNALAHPARLEILEVLRGREACVCHIQAMSNQRQSYISQQLNVLKQAGIVTSRKEGQWIFYRASEPGLYDLIDRVKGILHSLGREQPDFSPASVEAAEKKACSCPQCSPQAGSEPCIPLEVSHG